METQLMRDLLYTLMEGRQTTTSTLNDKDLPLAEFIALAQIEPNREDSPENVYADDLQQVLFVSKPAISQMLKSLEKKGYIRRDINLRNRRKLNVTLTTQGQKALKSARTYYSVAMGRISERFGDDKTHQLTTLLSEFTSIAREVRKDMEAEALAPSGTEVAR